MTLTIKTQVRAILARFSVLMIIGVILITQYSAFSNNSYGNSSINADSIAAGTSIQAKLSNSIGMDLVLEPAGSFFMGSEDGDWDEVPVHQVTISNPFYISEFEVSLAQYQMFKPSHQQQSPNGAVTGVSWYDAQAFCEWLTEYESKTYRLPTEAEWEIACRRHGTSQLSTMRDITPEWCSDWYGPYSAEDQIDPVGVDIPAIAKLKVIRGGKVDDDQFIELINDLEPGITAAYYHRAENRSSLPPNFGLPPTQNGDIGKNIIGFRVVQAEIPDTKPSCSVPPFIAQGIKEGMDKSNQGPSLEEPYFRKRYLLPRPPDNNSRENTVAVGLPEALQFHNHSPALEVCPNGDLLVIFFSAPQWNKEKSPNVPLIATRLRFGADQWEFPELFLDCADTKETSPLLWTDWENGGRMYLFWGHNAIQYGSYPFQWMTSTDNGATWGPVYYPTISGSVGQYDNQPINTAFRDNSGKLYISCDGYEGTSLLWATEDDGTTWYDTGGRTKGRHTTFCLLNNGTILGMGGKEAGINGYLAKSISTNQGNSYTFQQTPFSQLGGNQRPSILKLANGHLLFAGDWQTIWGKKPTGVSENGSFVALSIDNGANWTIKNIPVAQPHEQLGPRDFNILGYSALCQAKNGMVHLITTMNTPCLHFEFNEAWVLDAQADASGTDGILMPNTATSIKQVEMYSQKYSNGKTRISWQAGIGNDDRYLLHGDEKWYYEDGSLKYHCRYSLGQKIGTETLFNKDSSIIWQWEQQNNQVRKWTQWWETGSKKAESYWQNFRTVETAHTWDRSGNILTTKYFGAADPGSSTGDSSGGSSGGTLQQQVQVYPSQTHGLVNVSLPNQGVVEIYNTVGQKLMDIDVGKYAIIDLTEFNSGMYYLKFFLDNQSVTRHVLKLK